MLEQVRGEDTIKRKWDVHSGRGSGRGLTVKKILEMKKKKGLVQT